jgi:hypothetical protein
LIPLPACMVSDPAMMSISVSPEPVFANRTARCDRNMICNRREQVVNRHPA